MRMRPLRHLANQLEQGVLSSRELVEHCIDAISSQDDPAAQVFLRADSAGSQNAASQIDRLRRDGEAPSPWAGVPISIKALFDVEGWTTSAGSRLLADAPAASADAEAVARLRAAGFILMGHTNMTEFAYSGLGLNPHYGTPPNPFDSSRIPGGSSSGAAVGLVHGMAFAGLGTDTGGSCRIPAAFCGATGFKPTARRVPQRGTFPLSPSFDSVGTIAPSVDCCAVLDAILAGEKSKGLSHAQPSDLRLAVLDNYVWDSTEEPVAEAFDTVLKKLERAGVRVERIRLPELESLPVLNARGGIIAAEAYDIHRGWLEKAEELYDPRVKSRIMRAELQEPEEYQRLLDERRRIMSRCREISDGYDGVLFPTTPLQAPLLRDVDQSEDSYNYYNLLALRNPTVANFLDVCAISLPIESPNYLPVGLMIMGAHMADRRLLGVGAAIEQLVGPYHENLD